MVKQTSPLPGFLTAVAVCVAGGACSTAETYRTYEGDRPLSEVATVIWDGSIRPLVIAVNGRELPQAKVAMNRVEVLPGRHEFTVLTRGGRTQREMWTVEAGACYLPAQSILDQQRQGEKIVLTTYTPPRLVKQHDHPTCTKR